MKIGIPNTLFASYHLPYWQQFLNVLGMEVVISGDSCKEMINAGGKLIPHEFCLPLKIFLGHIVNLVEQKVDLILVPRMLSKGKLNFFCPKLTGLPDIVKHAAGLSDSALFSPEVTCNGLYLQVLKYPKPKLRTSREFHRAEQQANHHWEQALLQCRQDHLTVSEVCCHRKSSTNKSNIKLGLLGYAYAIYDPFISKGIIGKLSDLGAGVCTWEMIDFDLIENKLRGLKRPLFWNFGRILLGAGLHFLDDPGIDGIIYATTFGCGPDSIAIKLLSLEAAAAVSKKPFLQITLDEHSEDGHLKTRLEAFMDMLSAQKEGC
jgi:predicted nucleotide-binding protein (sugar kinase/HSP70/actin superfamily)